MHRVEQTPQRSKSKGCLRTLLRGLVVLTVLVVLLAVLGFSYEHYASGQDPKRYPPLGRLIDVENHQMHLYCTGNGAPTVVLESPATGSAIDWGYVQPEIAKFTRVCAYDRAGFAWSEAGPQPRTARQAAQELELLLRTAGESGPFVLVGASYGGHVVRLFANDYPNQTRGVVLVDARPERLFSIPTFRQQANDGLGIVGGLAALSDFGFARPFIALIPDRMIPPAAVPLYKAKPGSFSIVFQSKMWQASSDEAHAMDTSDEQVAAIQSMGDIPLIVLRHGKPMFGSFAPDEAAKMEAQWQALQEEIAAKSSRSQIVVATSSGHGIQIEQPAIIVDAVRQLAKQSTVSNWLQ